MTYKLQLRSFTCAIVVFLFCLTVSLRLCAQGAISGTINGTITDPSGAVVPNAQVVERNTGTHISTTVTTSAKGFYSVPNLNAGTYEVTGAPGSGFFFRNDSSSDMKGAIAC